MQPDESRTRPKITHVAIRFQGVIYALPAPNRHHHVLGHIRDMTGASSIDVDEDDEGFLDESGRYLRRPQALVSALMNKQVKDDSFQASGLFSEDVW